MGDTIQNAVNFRLRDSDVLIRSAEAVGFDVWLIKPIVRDRINHVALHPNWRITAVWIWIKT